LGAKRPIRLCAGGPGRSRPLGLLVLSLRQSELLHVQNGASSTATPDRAGCPGGAFAPVPSICPRQLGVRAVPTRHGSVLPSGIIVTPRRSAPSLSAELHVSDLIFFPPRP